MKPVIDIFIRTYFRDFRWLELCLLSIAKHVEGFRRIIVAMPASSLARLREGVIPASAGAVIVTCPEYENDYLGQQVDKLNGDLFTDASFIAHVDSDCFFHRPCCLPALLMRNGQPVVRFHRQSRRTAHDGWRRCIADFHGAPLPFDPLVPLPAIYPFCLYGALRARCWERHGTTINGWVLSRRLDAVSEFALLAGEAWLAHRDEFCWICADGAADWPCVQSWSRSPRAAEIRAKLWHMLDASP
jgi:hypothetical protein